MRQNPGISIILSQILEYWLARESLGSLAMILVPPLVTLDQILSFFLDLKKMRLFPLATGPKLISHHVFGVSQNLYFRNCFLAKKLLTFFI